MNWEDRKKLKLPEPRMLHRSERSVIAVDPATGLKRQYRQKGATYMRPETLAAKQYERTLRQGMKQAKDFIKPVK